MTIQFRIGAALAVLLYSAQVTAAVAGTIVLTIQDNVANVSTTWQVPNDDIARAKSAVIALNKMVSPTPQQVIDQVGQSFFDLLQALTVKYERDQAAAAATVSITPISGSRQ